MDREEIARGRRRQHALELLEFEREREAALRDQLEEVITEQLGSQVDESAFARMAAEDVEVVRDALVGAPYTFEEDGLEAETVDWSGEAEVEDEAGDDDGELEIGRLEAELAECRRRQQAFESYLESVGGLASE